MSKALVEVKKSAPEPDPEGEARVRAFLETLDSLLDIQWFPNVRWDPRQDTWQGRYALVCRWPQEDRRWELYRSGEIGDCHDILGWFTEAVRAQVPDWQEGEALPTSLDGIEGAILDMLGRQDNTRTSWMQRMKASVEANAARRKKVMEEAQDEILEGLGYKAKWLRNEPIVNLGRGLAENGLDLGPGVNEHGTQGGQDGA